MSVDPFLRYHNGISTLYKLLLMYDKTDRRKNNPELIYMNQKLEKLNTKVTTLEDSFTVHVQEEAGKFDQMIAIITENTISINKLAESTQQIVDLQRDLKGVVRIGSGLKNFLVWVAKFGVVGAAIVAATNEILKHFGSSV